MKYSIAWLPEAVLRQTLIIGRYEAGENLFVQDEPTTGSRVILEGRVAVDHVDNDGNVVSGRTHWNCWAVGCCRVSWVGIDIGSVYYIGMDVALVLWG
ncbi:MAG: hypothetical protein C7B46_12185 [Sulfobacillus benefaciens]|uniref:Uncharacterized protein n=1 Tax=Sulfobacillus benefaciens TaxID=453960 RepID=A0A2T2XEU1_9FIRM|nr:MAG: hypothetical protein C7B46_12185 [Sulfobacillus benefaciens]